jgi:hypothetical protein
MSRHSFSESGLPIERSPDAEVASDANPSLPVGHTSGILPHGRAAVLAQ